MRVKDLLSLECIELNGSASGKDEVIKKIGGPLVKRGKLADRDTY